MFLFVFGIWVRFPCFVFIGLYLLLVVFTGFIGLLCCLLCLLVFFARCLVVFMGAGIGYVHFHFGGFW